METARSRPSPLDTWFNFEKINQKQTAIILAKVMFAQSKPSVYKRSTEILSRDGKSNVLQILGINSILAQKLIKLKKSLSGVYVKVGQDQSLAKYRPPFDRLKANGNLKHHKAESLTAFE